MLGQIMIQLVPVTIALALFFTVLTQLWPVIPAGRGGASASMTRHSRARSPGNWPIHSGSRDIGAIGGAIFALLK